MKLSTLVSSGELEIVHQSDHITLDHEITGVDLPEKVSSKNSVVFISTARFLNKYLEASPALSHGVILSTKLLEDVEKQKKIFQKADWVACVENIDLIICKVSKVLYDQKYKSFDYTLKQSLEKFSHAKIAEDVFIGSNVELGENVVLMSGVRILGDVNIGNNTIIYPNVSIYPGVILGDNCRVHSSVTIGSDGFGYKFINGAHHKIWHYGGVIIGSDVEIGSGTCIDGGTFTPTTIGSGTKIDNQVQIAHNSKIGEHVILCGKAGLAGSSSVDDYCVLGGGAGIGPDCHLGKGCKVGGGGMVNKDWPAGSVVSGYPAIELRDWKRAIIKFQRLSQRS